MFTIFFNCHLACRPATTELDTPPDLGTWEWEPGQIHGWDLAWILDPDLGTYESLLRQHGGP